MRRHVKSIELMRRVSADGWIVDEEILSDEYGNYGESVDASHGVSFWAAGSQSDQGATQVLCFSCGTRPSKYEGSKITQCDECCDKERHRASVHNEKYLTLFKQPMCWRFVLRYTGE